MYTEYCNYNRSIDSYEEEIKSIYKAIDLGINGIAAQIHLIREIKEYMPKDILLSSPIDYPMGISSTKSREVAAITAIKSGVSAIDYVPNQYFLKSKFTELKKEVGTILRMCKDYDVTMRVFIDSGNIYNPVSISRILFDMGVTHIFTSLGYHKDNFYDALINAKKIQEVVDVGIIFSGHIWLEEQLQIIIETGLFGVRLHNLHVWCNSLKD